MYMYGKGGVKRDPAEAAKWYRMAGVAYREAAEKGDVEAQSSLGSMYENGHGIERDYVEAAKWYRKAAEQGDMMG